MLSSPRIPRRKLIGAGLCALAPLPAVAQKAATAKSVYIADAALRPDKIDAKDIVSGTPRAGDFVFSKSADSRETRGIWSCTRGSFHWTFDTDETAVVLEGRATVHMEDGTVISLKPGDMAFFPNGQKSTWTIEEDLRKAYILYGKA